jgi:hypothetical protein
MANSTLIPATCSASMRAQLDIPQGTAAITFTLSVNAGLGFADTTTSCTIASAATSCSSATPHAINAGDFVTVHLTSAASDYGNANLLWLSMKCQ